MANRILNLKGDKARNKLIVGAKYLAESLALTLGPYGQNWFLEKGSRITNDGKTIADNLHLRDEFENRGLSALREVCTKVVDEVGDGTTSAAVFCMAIIDSAVRLLGDKDKGLTAKRSPVDVTRQIEKEAAEVKAKLIDMAKPIKTKAELIEAARVSVEDEELAKLIGETQWDLGKDGIILAEESAETKCSMEKIHGLRIDNGFGASHMINNHEKQTLEITDSVVILTNYTFQNLNPIKRILDELNKAGKRTLTIVARAFTAEAIQICLKNINEGGMKIYPINAPFTDQAELMKDLAAVLGGTFIHDEERGLEDILISDIGFVQKIIAARYSAVLTGKKDADVEKRVATRVEQLKEKLKGSVSEFEKKHIEGRVAQLENGFALLKVGALSDTQRKYKKDKADDAVNATRAAYQEGVVPGAGQAFKIIADDLPESYIIKRPLYAIYEQIKASAPEGWEIPKWVRDPVKVQRVILDRAVAVGCAFATAGGVTATESERPPLVRLSNQEENAQGE